MTPTIWIRHSTLPPLSRRPAEARKRYAQAAAPLLAELAQAGIAVEDVDVLNHEPAYYNAALSILLTWLPRIEDKYVKSDIVRVLTDRRARSTAAPVLIGEYKRVVDPTGTGLKWTIANALSVIADDSVFHEMVELVTDRRHGRAREMLAVSLGNMKTPEAVDVLISLLSDDEVAGHALIALGNLKAQRARPFIESFLAHPKAWVRKEARRALGKLERAKV